MLFRFIQNNQDKKKEYAFQRNKRNPLFLGHANRGDFWNLNFRCSVNHQQLKNY